MTERGREGVPHLLMMSPIALTALTQKQRSYSSVLVSFLRWEVGVRGRVALYQTMNIVNIRNISMDYATKLYRRNGSPPLLLRFRHRHCTVLHAVIKLTQRLAPIIHIMG